MQLKGPLAIVNSLAIQKGYAIDPDSKAQQISDRTIECRVTFGDDADICQDLQKKSAVILVAHYGILHERRSGFIIRRFHSNLHLVSVQLLKKTFALLYWANFHSVLI